MTKIIFSLFICMFFCANKMNGQVFPVSASSSLKGPYSTYFADYIALGSNKFSLNIFFNDFTKPSYTIRLKMSITSTNVNIVSKDAFWTTRYITIYPGLNVFTGVDLKDFFNTNNMTITSASSSVAHQISSSKSLPEGFYTFCFDVYDYRVNKKISNGTCVSHGLYRNFPPTLISPDNNSVITNTTNQVINMGWQTNSDASFSLVYDLKLVEVPSGIAPTDAINATSKPVVVYTNIATTHYHYGLSDPQLTIGKTYAWIVHVVDKNGSTTFENNGYSYIRSFTFGHSLNDSISVISPVSNVKLRKADSLVLSWRVSKDLQTDVSTKYLYKVVKIAPGQSPVQAMLSNTPVWNPTLSTQPHIAGVVYSVVIRDSLPMLSNFAWQVSAYHGISLVAMSDIQAFRTPSGTGIDRFMAGNNQVYVSTISHDDSTDFSGTGKVRINASGETADVSFSHLSINKAGEKFALLSGTVRGAVNKKIPLATDNNDEAYFLTDSVLVTKNSFQLVGAAKWEYPVPTLATDTIATLSTERATVDYNNFSISQTLNANENKFELLEPLNVSAHFFNTTKFSISGNKLTLTLQGEYIVPVKNSNPFTVPITNAPILMPPKPVLMSASAEGNKIEIHWLPTLEGIGSRYLIYKSIGSSPNLLLIDSAQRTDQSYIDTLGITPLSQYSYMIKGKSSSGFISEGSDVLSVSTPEANAPAIVKTVSDSVVRSRDSTLKSNDTTGIVTDASFAVVELHTKGNTRKHDLRLRWSISADYHLMGYIVFRRRDSAAMKPKSGLVKITSRTEKGLPRHTTFTYKVVAYFKDGSKKESNEVEVERK